MGNNDGEKKVTIYFFLKKLNGHTYAKIFINKLLLH